MESGKEPNMKILDMQLDYSIKMSPTIKKLHDELLYKYDDYYENELRERIYDLLMSNTDKIADIVRQLDRDFKQGILVDN